jgi:hypothetical protein
MSITELTMPGMLGTGGMTKPWDFAFWQDAGPIFPSGTSPLSCCHSLVASVVCLPQIPSVFRLLPIFALRNFCQASMELQGDELDKQNFIIFRLFGGDTSDFQRVHLSIQFGERKCQPYSWTGAAGSQSSQQRCIVYCVIPFTKAKVSGFGYSFVHKFWQLLIWESLPEWGCWAGARWTLPICNTELLVSNLNFFDGDLAGIGLHVGARYFFRPGIEQGPDHDCLACFV